MTKTPAGTTALWLLVALFADQGYVRGQQPGQASTNLQAQTTPLPNVVQGALSNGMTMPENAITRIANTASGQPISPQQQQQQQQQQQHQPLRQTSAGAIQQPLDASQIGASGGAQMPMPQNYGGQVSVNGQPIPPQVLQQTVQSGMQPRPNYGQQIPQMDHNNPQHWKPQLQGVPQMQHQQMMSIQPQQQLPVQQHQQQLPIQPQQQLPVQQHQQQLPIQPQQQQLQMPPQQYGMQINPQRPVQMQMQPPPQQYGAMQNMGYQNPNVQQYPTSPVAVNSNQGFTNFPTSGQPMGALPGGGLLRQNSTPFGAAFSLLDPMPVGKQALDVTSSTIGSAWDTGVGLKNSVGGAAVDVANKVVDGTDSIVKGMFGIMEAVPAVVTGVKRNIIRKFSNVLDLPNSNQQQQQQQQRLQQQKQQQDYSYQQPYGQVQYGYNTQQSSQAGGRPAAAGYNPLNAPQPIMRYNANSMGNIP